MKMTREEAAEVLLEGVWLTCERCKGKGYESSITELCAGCGREGFIRHPRANEACLVLGAPVPEKPECAAEMLMRISKRISERVKDVIDRPSQVRTIVKLDVDDDKGTGS